MNITTLATKTKALSAAITAGGLLLFLFAVGTLTVTKNHGALFTPEAPADGEAIPAVSDRLTTAYNDDIVGFDRFISVYGITQRLLGTSVYEDAGYTYLIRDRQDFLHFHTTRADAAPYADAVIRLRDALSAHDIPLLYLQAPTKEIPAFTEYPAGIAYESDENALAMRTALRDGGVEVLSFAEAFASQNRDPGTLFYRTDHHWTTEAAFAAFGTALPRIAELTDTALDLSTADAANWTVLSQPQSFLGSIGRRVGVELAGLDDYTYLEPAFATSYDVFYPPTSRETPYWTGDFHATMVRDTLLYAEDVTANRYASYFQYDYGELIIRNLLAENDLRVAIVKDSFALPFTAFLSTAVGEITMYDLREFEGSLTETLIAYDPDLVLILYGNGSFSDAMYQFEG